MNVLYIKDWLCNIEVQNGLKDRARRDAARQNLEALCNIPNDHPVMELLANLADGMAKNDHNRDKGRVE